MWQKLLAVAACATSLVLAKAPERPLQVVTTDQVDFTSGTVHVNNAYGELNVEGWDQPRVEITVTRTAFRGPDAKDQEQGKAYLNRIQVTARKTANGDIEIFTTFPGRNRLVRAIWGLGNFNLDYRIKVPRAANVTVVHGVGDVMVRDVAGDIHATIRTGDILVELPDPEKYAIDAQCRFGDIYTDFDGTHHSPWLVGQKFEGGSGHSIQLRALFGGITIQRAPATVAPAISAPPQ